eukprot:1230864-Amphidinium_carterae.1
MKREHVRQGHVWSDAVDAELKDGVRSCERGQGPPKKASTTLPGEGHQRVGCASAGGAEWSDRA